MTNKVIAQRTRSTVNEITHDAVTRYLSNEHGDASVRTYLAASLADNTLRAYRGDIKHFMNWGGVIPASAECVATYIARHATILSSSTLSRRLVGIGRAHTVQGFVSPTRSALVRATLQGVRRSRGTAVRQVSPLNQTDVVQMVRGLNGLRGLRDAALLLIGFAGALRRAELVSLNVEDIRFTGDGMIIHLRRSKTDQTGIGREIAIPFVKGRYCPCRNLVAWVREAEITTGAVFHPINRYDQVLPQRLTAQSVALIVKQHAPRVGLDARKFSGHSLRAGFVTSAAKAGASSSSIRAQTGHTSDAMLQRYIRQSELFSGNPNGKIW